MFKPTASSLFAAAAVIAASATAVSAADTCSGCLKSQPSTTNRPQNAGAVWAAGCTGTAPDSFNDAVPYKVIRMRTGPASQSIDLSVVSLEPAGSKFDPFVAIYCVPFNPATPAANLVAIDDDSLGYPNSRIVGLTLPGNTDYDVVVSAYSNYQGASTGHFQVSVGGAATLSCCPGDFNNNGTVSVQDIFDFLAAYFTNEQCAPRGYDIQATSSAFEDLSATGTLLATASNCDDCGDTVTPGFTFNYLGNPYMSLWVCSNGFVQFGGANNADYINATIPTTGTPDNFVCPLWDDMRSDTSGDVYSRVDGGVGTHRLTISWQNISKYSNTTIHQTFQVMMYEATGNIEFRYGAITPEATAGDYTIGYENSAGTAGASVPTSLLGSGSRSFLLTPLASPSSCGCAADVNSSGSVSVQDIFDFLAAYFAGCN